MSTETLDQQKSKSDSKQEYLETYMPKPDADPHGGSEDFEKMENPALQKAEME